MKVNQQAFMSGMCQQLEKQALLGPVGMGMVPLMALVRGLQAKKGEGWSGAGYGALQGSLVPTGAILGGLGGGGLGYGVGALLSHLLGAEKPKGDESSLGGLIGGGLGGLAGLGLGGYGGHKAVDYLVGPKFKKEVFGDIDDYDLASGFKRTKDGEIDYSAGLTKKKDLEKEKQATEKAKKQKELWGALSGVGKGKGQPGGGRRNINTEPCPDEGPGKAKGKGRGKGKNR